MAIFANSSATQATTVTNSATKIFNQSASGIPANGQTLGDVIVVNTGTTTIFLGQSGVTASTGLRLPAGAQVTYNGFGAVQGSTTYDIYAITSSGTSTTLTGLATVNANV